METRACKYHIHNARHDIIIWFNTNIDINLESQKELKSTDCLSEMCDIFDLRIKWGTKLLNDHIIYKPEVETIVEWCHVRGDENCNAFCMDYILIIHFDLMKCRQFTIYDILDLIPKWSHKL